MKGKQFKQYSAEFKLEAVRLFNSGGKQVTQLARELGVPRQRLYNWVRQAESRKGKAVSEVFPGRGNRTADDAEVQRLRRENVQLKEDNEILKKAAAFFAKESR